jgi:tRNA-uridine 2-sulfurtransferase
VGRPFLAEDPKEKAGNTKSKAVSLLSGGLDSLLASRIVLDLGVEVIGLHFTSPMCNSIADDDGNRALRAGRELGIRVIVRDKGEEYLNIIRNPKHGYGRNMNPCIDCRIYMLHLTRAVMAEEGATFVVTGEVLGQRPMSQRRVTMDMIEKESGLEGLILRPLSARLFPPTLPEKEGIVDRERLYDVSGRSRHRQYKLSQALGLKEFSCPAGGCLLTDPIFAWKLRDLFDHEAAFDMTDVGLLRLGRHFRFEGRRLVFGRNREENDYVEGSWSHPYTLIRPKGFKGPSGIVKGDVDEVTLEFIAAILASYGRESGRPVAFEVYDGETREYAVEPVDIDIEYYRVKEKA